MPCRGVFFGLEALDERGLLMCDDQDEEVLELVNEHIDQSYEQQWRCPVDKAWDAIHRCLSGGSLDYDDRNPLSHVVLGGRQLYTGNNYIVSYKNIEAVKIISAALLPVTADTIRASYWKICEKSYGMKLTEDDCEYTQAYFQDLKDFYARACQSPRAVIFAVDQ